jgi:hypothetical protein
MVKHKKIAITAGSFMDLQLKLAKHANWRILDISRLNPGFKIIFQRTAKEHRRHLPDAVIHLPSKKSDFIGHRSSPSSHKNI